MVAVSIVVESTDTAAIVVVISVAALVTIPAEAVVEVTAQSGSVMGPVEVVTTGSGTSKVALVAISTVDNTEVVTDISAVELGLSTGPPATVVLT